jgi:hypothetical protein
MANAVYPKYIKATKSGSASIDLLAGTVKFVLLDTGAYTYSATHEFLSDIPGGAQISITGALTSKSVGDDGSFKSANPTFTSVTSVSVEAIAMFVDTGSPSSSRLVFFQDTGVTGLPVTPAGASYNLIMDSAGWFI